MGYLNSTAITVDAILTKKGRELIAKGQGFNITQFAVADDEVDYSLWNVAHPLGSNFYGSAIEALPVTEAVPDETQAMRYKLVTLPRGTKTIPLITMNVTNIILTFGQNGISITPSTTNGLNGTGFGYTAILFDSTAGTLVGTGLPVTAFDPSIPASLTELSTAYAVVAKGLQFTLSPKDVAAQITTVLTVIGNQTGAAVSIPVVVNPKPNV